MYGTTTGNLAHFALTRTIEPALAPLDRDVAVKPWLRVDADDTGQDAVIDALIAAAARRCERVTGRALLTQTWRFALDWLPGGYFGGWIDGPGFYQWGGGSWQPVRLPRPPLASVTSLQYVDMGGATQTLAPSAYLVDTASEPGRVTPAYGTFWPVTRPQVGAVIFTYVAGYASAALVPDDIKQALLMCCAYCWREREAPDEALLDRLFQPYIVGDTD